MLFQNKLHSAIMSHVKTKIKQAESEYQEKLKQHHLDYKQEIISAKQMLEQKQNIALEESIQSVIKSII